MIGFVTDLLVVNVLDPQALEERGETRAYVDVEGLPVDADPQELDLLPLSTTIRSREIGGSIELRHTIDVGLDVQHGDAGEARRLRDAIVLELVLRHLDARDAYAQAVDPVSAAYVIESGFTIDYRPLAVGDTDTNASATISFVFDTALDR